MRTRRSSGSSQITTERQCSRHGPDPFSSFSSASRADGSAQLTCGCTLLEHGRYLSKQVKTVHAQLLWGLFQQPAVTLTAFATQRYAPGRAALQERLAAGRPRHNFWCGPFPWFLGFLCYNLFHGAWTDASGRGLVLGTGKVYFLTVSCR